MLPTPTRCGPAQHEGGQRSRHYHPVTAPRKVGRQRKAAAQGALSRLVSSPVAKASAAAATKALA